MLEFITANLAIIICFVVGIGLMIVEAFLPGFGLPGIGGGALEVAAVVLTCVQHGPLAGAIVLLVAASVLAIAITCSLRSAARGRLNNTAMVLKETESAEAGYSATEDLSVFIGREGKVLTALRPTGTAEFDGVRLNVASEGDYLPPGTPVRIIRAEGSKVLVRDVRGS